MMLGVVFSLDYITVTPGKLHSRLTKKRSRQYKVQQVIHIDENVPGKRKFFDIVLVSI